MRRRTSVDRGAWLPDDARRPDRLAARAAARAGFTLMEMLVASLVMVILVSAALPFLANQPKVIAAAAMRGEATQNARFALNAVERELRMVGTGTLLNQPMIVYADQYAVTFNADLITNNASDVWSVSYDADVTDNASLALQPPGVAPPRGGTGFVYPSAAFLDRDGSPAGAETVSFWVSPDSSSPRPNEYVLFRRVNREPASVVTTGIVISPGKPFFQYTYADTAGRLDSLPQTFLPVRHLASVHGSAADTGEASRYASRIDRIRTITVFANAQYKDPRRSGQLGLRQASSNTTLINVTALRRNSCGTAPDPTAVLATLVKVNGQPSYMHLMWMSATDDGAGERDIDRYLIYRTENGAALVDPITDVPAVNQASHVYTYDDYDVKRTAPANGQNAFRYAAVAQDCQPQTATATMSSAVNVPVVP